MQRVAQRLNQLRLAKTGHSFQKNVSSSQNGHQDVVDDVGIADDDLRDLLMHPAEFRLEGIHLTVVIGHGVGHPLRVTRAGKAPSSRKPEARIGNASVPEPGSLGPHSGVWLLLSGLLPLSVL